LKCIIQIFFKLIYLKKESKLQISCFHMLFLILCLKNKNRTQHLKYKKMGCKKMNGQTDFFSFIKKITNAKYTCEG